MTLPPADVLKLIAENTFRPFTKNDWYGFAGCETENPLICDTHPDYVIVIDGNVVSMVPARENLDGEYGYELRHAGD